MRRTLISAALVAAVNARVLKRDLTPQTISGWMTEGCWSDDPNNRTLNNLVGVGQDISGTQCQAKCQQLGYLYAGNEFGGQCYCDDSLHSAVQEADSDCSTACPGDQTQPCGAANRINIYKQIPSQDYNIQGWSSYGCISDSVYKRALRYPMNADNMTPEVCTSACAAAGYSLAGLEFSSECFCDNYIQNSQTLIDPASCNMACSGDGFLACGGAAALDLLYVAGTTPTAQPNNAHAISLPAGWSFSNCYTDSTTARALSNYITGPASGMTVEACVSGCAAAGFTKAGLEFGDECYCGNEVDNGQSVATDGGCNMPCSGDNTEVCGGAGHLSLFRHTPPHWSYEGCFSGVSFPFYKDYGTYAVSTCESDCAAAGYDAAAWHGTQCFCGQQSNLNGAQTADGGSCGYTCGGPGHEDGSCFLAPNDYLYFLGY